MCQRAAVELWLLDDPAELVLREGRGEGGRGGGEGSRVERGVNGCCLLSALITHHKVFEDV